VTSSTFRASISPSSAVEAVAPGRGLVLPITIPTPSAAGFAAIAQSARTPAPVRLGLPASLPLTSGMASSAATVAQALAVYAESEFAAEIAHFLSQPGLRLALLA
jgi:hypothetical protein